MASRQGCLVIVDHQIATDRVGVDRPVEMAPAVEVVGQAESKTIAQIALDTKINLLRIGVDKVLGLRIAKGLEGQRQGRRRTQIVLVEKNRLGKIQSLKLLLVRKKSQSAGDRWVDRSGAGIGQAGNVDGQSLKNRDCV